MQAGNIGTGGNAEKSVIGKEKDRHSYHPWRSFWLKIIRFSLLKLLTLVILFFAEPCIYYGTYGT